MNFFFVLYECLKANTYFYSFVSIFLHTSVDNQGTVVLSTLLKNTSFPLRTEVSSMPCGSIEIMNERE